MQRLTRLRSRFLSGLWRITVTDISTNMGVANAKVCLFAGGGGIEPPENADYTQYTDANGVVIFDVPPGFYRVGVFASGYESAYDPHDPPADWLDVWTCWGAGGAGHDYDFAVTPTGVPEPNGVAPEIPWTIIFGGLIVAGILYFTVGKMG